MMQEHRGQTIQLQGRAFSKAPDQTVRTLGATPCRGKTKKLSVWDPVFHPGTEGPQRANGSEWKEVWSVVHSNTP